MTPIGSSSTISTLPPAFQEAELLGKLRLEHVRLKQGFNYHNMHDSMTVLLSAWHEAFGEALESRNDAETILREFIPLLQRVLCDDMPGLFFPLDSQCYLCSDGHTVGHKALSVYLHFLPEKYKGCSPFHPENRAGLTVKPHPIARAFIAWLEKHGSAPLTHPRLEALHAELERKHTLPRIPFPCPRGATFAERVERLRRDQQERAEAAQETTQTAPTTDPIDPIIEEVEQANERERTREAEREQEATRIRKEVEDDIRDLLAEIEEIKRQNQLLDEELHSIRGSIDTMRARTIQLQQSINQVSQAIVESKAAASEGLTAALCTMVACIAIKLALPELPVTPAPLPGGGGMLHFTTTF